MRAFQTICVALAVAMSRGQYITNGASYSTGSISYGSVPSSVVRTSYVSAAPAAVATVAAPVLTRTIAVQAAPVVTRAVAVQAAPVVTRAVAVQAAPAIAVQAAPAAIAYSSGAAQSAVNLGVIATAPGGGIRSHEIHTGSGRQAIRIEEVQSGDQVIRVQEGPQAPPQIAQVQVPGEQHHIRIINQQSGPAQVERVVARQQTQVFNVQRPGRPGARIVQVVKGQSAAPSIEFIESGGNNQFVYRADDAGSAGVAVSAGPAISVAAAPIAIQAQPIAVRTVQAAPVSIQTVQAAPVAIQAVQAAPVAVQAVHAAPVLTRTVAVQAAPLVQSAVIGGNGIYSSY